MGQWAGLGSGRGQWELSARSTQPKGHWGSLSVAAGRGASCNTESHLAHLPFHPPHSPSSQKCSVFFSFHIPFLFWHPHSFVNLGISFTYSRASPEGRVGGWLGAPGSFMSVGLGGALGARRGRRRGPSGQGAQGQAGRSLRLPQASQLWETGRAGAAGLSLWVSFPQLSDRTSGLQ